MARTICTVTLVRNCEKFILPHLNMLQGVDKRKVLFLERPFKPYVHAYPEQPDRAIDLVKTFSDIEIESTDIDSYSAEVYNKVLDMGKDYDIVLFLHADILTTQDEFKKLTHYIRNTDFDCYRMDFTKCVMNYYRDFEHGIRDCLDHDPIAVSPKGKMHNILTYKIGETEGKTTEINFMNFHHFTGFKTVPYEWIETQVGEDMQRKYGAWISCPIEVRKLFDVNKKHGLLTAPYKKWYNL